MMFNVAYEIYKKQHPERKSHYDIDWCKKIPAIRYVNFEHWNFPVEIDDDENNEFEEFEKDNGNRISVNVYGIHNDVKNHCEDARKGTLCPSKIVELVNM